MEMDIGVKWFNFRDSFRLLETMIKWFFVSDVLKNKALCIAGSFQYEDLRL